MLHFESRDRQLMRRRMAHPWVPVETRKATSSATRSPRGNQTSITLASQNNDLLGIP
jgi:hypothetical protein